MSTITVELEQELAALLHTTPGRTQDKLKEYVVLELYRRHEISSGKAAELLAMERFEFVRYAARLGIPYLDMDEQELAKEFELAQKAA